MRCYRLLVAVLWQFCALLTMGGPAHAAPNHIAAELVAESTGMPGETITLAIAMRPEEGWHGYWSKDSQCCSTYVQKIVTRTRWQKS